MNLSETHAEDSRYALLAEFALSLSKASDMKAFARDVVPKLKYMIDFNRCTLALLNDDGRTYRLSTLLETRQKMPRNNKNRVSLKNGISGKVIHSKEMCVFDRRGHDWVNEWPVADEAMEGGSLNSIMCLPLQVSGKSFGALTVGTTLTVGYSQADISMASLIANHLSLAVDRWTVIRKLRSANAEIRKLNTELEGRVQERTEELAQTNTRLSKEVEIRRKTEAALRESEVKYRSIFTEARDGIILANSAGQIVECNPEFERQTGRNAAELKRMKVWQVRPANEVEQARRIFKAVVKHGVGQSEIRFEKPNRELVDIDLRAKSVRINNKKYVLGLVRDVTERKRHEEELRKKSEIFRHAHWGMAISTSDGMLEQVNPAFARMHGYSVEELQRRPLVEVYAREGRAELPTRLEEIEQRGHLAWETQHVRKDGSIFPVLMNVFGVKDADGALRFRVANVMDISERKRAERALKANEERFRSLYTKTPVMLHSVDASGKLISVSDHWLDKMGYRRDEVIGRRSTEFLTEASRERAETICMPEFFKTGWLKEEGLQLVKKNGEVMDVLLSAIAERDPKCNIVRTMAVLVDVTARMQAERELMERMHLSSFSANLGGVLTYGGNVRELLQRCAESLVEGLHVALARIWMVDKSGDTLVMKASAGMYSHTDGQHGQVPIGKYKIGLIAQEGNPHLTNDVTRDPRIHDQSWAKEHGLVAFAGYPLIFENEVVGVMAMFSRTSLSTLTFEGLSSAASAIAVGIKRAQADEALREAKESLELRVKERTAKLSQANKLLGSKNVELEKRTAEVEAVNQELETFAYTVSHDLRSPLLTIHGFSQILAEDYSKKLGETASRYIELIQSNSIRMAQIIEDLLELSKVTRGEIADTKVSLSELAATIAENLKTLEPERQVDFVFREDLTVEGDPRLLKLALVR